MISPDGGMQIAILYDCRSYFMVYDIEVAKAGRRIVISSVWTRQTVFLNGRAGVLLEFINSPNGGCRIASYGVVKIQK